MEGIDPAWLVLIGTVIGAVAGVGGSVVVALISSRAEERRLRLFFQRKTATTLRLGVWVAVEPLPTRRAPAGQRALLRFDEIAVARRPDTAGEALASLSRP